MSTNIVRKIPNNYVCNYCHYNTCSKKDYNKHLMTSKHNIATNPQQNDNHKILYICEHCSKEYKDRTGLWRHKQKCSHKNNIESDITNNIHFILCR